MYGWWKVWSKVIIIFQVRRVYMYFLIKLFTEFRNIILISFMENGEREMNKLSVYS